MAFSALLGFVSRASGGSWRATAVAQGACVCRWLVTLCDIPYTQEVLHRLLLQHRKYALPPVVAICNKLPIRGVSYSIPFYAQADSTAVGHGPRIQRRANFFVRLATRCERLAGDGWY